MCLSDSLRQKANRPFIKSLKARGLCVILFTVVIIFIQYKDHIRQTELNSIEAKQSQIMEHVGLTSGKE